MLGGWRALRLRQEAEGSERRDPSFVVLHRKTDKFVEGLKKDIIFTTMDVAEMHGGGFILAVHCALYMIGSSPWRQVYEGRKQKLKQ